MRQRLWLTTVVVGSFGLAGCATTANEQAFGKAVANAAASLDSGVSLAQKIRFEDQLTEASKAFLLTRPSAARLSRSCDTDADHEIVLAQKRKIMFSVVTAYFSSIDSMLTGETDFTKFASDVQAASGAISSLGIAEGPEVGVVNTVLGALAKAANGVEQDVVLRNIFRTAKSIQPQLQRVVRDIDAGLVTSEININAEIKLWEQCENERLLLIFADPATSRAEMSTMFETFRNKLASLKAQSGVVIGTRDTLNDVLKANAALASGRLTFEEAKAAVGDANTIVANFRAAIEAAGKL